MTTDDDPATRVLRRLRELHEEKVERDRAGDHSFAFDLAYARSMHQAHPLLLAVAEAARAYVDAAEYAYAIDATGIERAVGGEGLAAAREACAFGVLVDALAALDREEAP